MNKADLARIFKALKRLEVPFVLAGGPIDLEDARSILVIMKGKLDMKYLEGELKKRKMNLARIK